MSQMEVYQEIQQYLGQYLRSGMSQWTLDRLTLLVSGMLKAEHAAPARMARAGLGLCERAVQVESLERRLRRIENDPKLCPETCFWPLALQIIANSQPQEILLLVDLTTQDARVVLLSVNIWYRGRSLPLAWDHWPGEQPLKEEGLWERLTHLLDQVQPLLPPGVPVTVLADRAFGCAVFVDRVSQYGWHWVVRIKSNMRWRDRCGREGAVAQLVSGRGQRRKLHGQVFKSQGWRWAYVVVQWGKRFASPLCLVSDRPLAWNLLAAYRHRFAIEPTFRDFKSAGWQWEQGQVTDPFHLSRLLLGMALATWLTVLVGALQARVLLAQPPSGQRRTVPWWGKRSLFQLGLLLWSLCFAEGLPPWLLHAFPDWGAPNWSIQCRAHHARAFVFA